MEKRRFPFVLPAAVSLVFGMWAGLARMQVLPEAAPEMFSSHGALMASGFLGTLISLERAAAMEHFGFMAMPLSAGAGALLFLAGFTKAGIILVSTASAALSLTGIYAIAIAPTMASVAGTLGANAWFVGNLFWLAGAPNFEISFWWAAFLIFTIAAERLELSKLTGYSFFSRASFGVATVVFFAALFGMPRDIVAASRAVGAAVVLLACWLLYYDIGGRLLRRSGLPRYAAACLLSGYVWLAIAGIFMFGFPDQAHGVYYEIILHAIFLGFAMSMIFGHAPIILPAILGVQVRFHPVMYAPLALLHASLIVRTAGILMSELILRNAGGIVNVLAIGVFFTCVARLAMRSE